MVAETTPNSNQSSSMLNEHGTGASFPLMDLPLELRERIYFHACGDFLPIHTAAIADTPDRVVIPRIAQMSKQTRAEALAVFYRHRPVILSFHCDRNIRHARAWVDCYSHGEFRQFSPIICSGRMSQPGGYFFDFTIQYDRAKARWRVSNTYQFAADGPDRHRETMRAEVQSCIDQSTWDDDERRGGKLTSSALHDLIQCIVRVA